MSRPILFLIPLAFSACVSYSSAPVHVETVAASFRPLRPGPLPFEEAVRLVVERNPELLALRASASAVNVNPGPGALEGSLEVDDGDVTEVTLGTDVLALLGIGPRRAERALARARRCEAVLRHHERARDLVADLAEAYAVDRALSGVEALRPTLDVDAFAKAGLASEADVAASRAAHDEWLAQGDVLGVQRRDVRREVARLVAASPDSLVEPVVAAEDWPAVPEASQRSVLLARGDLQRLYGAYEVSDRAFRLAVAKQYPSLALRLGGNLHLDTPLQFVEVSLPLNAPAEARAARSSREAAFRDLEAGVLSALHDAASARYGLEEADANFRAARSRAAAAAALGKGAIARLEVDSSALGDAVLVAGEEVRSVRDLRDASVARARARVKAARAAGWPGPDVVRGGVR